MDSAALLDHLRSRELALLTPEVRCSAGRLAELLSDDIFEIGKSGRSYDKEDILKSAGKQPAIIEAPAESFRLRLLSAGVALLNYESISFESGHPVPALRTSVWRLEGEHWRLAFHQGTPVATELKAFMRHESTLVYPPEVLNLQRLRMRRPRFSDTSSIFEYASDPEVARYELWPSSLTAESVAERIGLREHQWNSGAEFYWVLTLPPADQAIGAVACKVSGHTAEFGFVLNRRFWRMGYATEAALAVVNCLLAVPSVWRVAATCDVENLASARVLEKAGLSREGILRRAIVRPNISDEPRDAFLYSKVRA